MPKCDLNKVAKQHGCSPVNLQHTFRTPFLKNTFRWLLLKVQYSKDVAAFLIIGNRFLKICDFKKF